MNDITTQWVIPIITNLIAAVAIWLIGKTAARARASIIRVKGVAIMVTKRIWPKVFNAAVYIGMFWFTISRLFFLVTWDGPVQRTDVLLIAVFTGLFFATLAALVVGAEPWPSTQEKKLEDTARAINPP